MLTFVESSRNVMISRRLFLSIHESRIHRLDAAYYRGSDSVSHCFSNNFSRDARSSLSKKFVFLAVSALVSDACVSACRVILFMLLSVFSNHVMLLSR